MIKIHQAFPLLFGLLATSAGLVACGEAEVQKTDIESIAMKQLTASVGKECPQITCPSNLKAKVGETMTCTMPVDGKPHDVAIKVTSVEGSTAKFDIEVK